MKEQIVTCVNAWWNDLCARSADPDEAYFNRRLENIFPDMKFMFNRVSCRHNGEWILL